MGHYIQKNIAIFAVNILVMANIKDIPGFNGRYSVTDDGTVISNNYQRTGKKKALKQI